MKKYPDNYLTFAQDTAEWLEARCGRVTASRIADVTSKLKNGKSSAAREKYKMELITEFLTGRAAEHYVTPAMDFGKENEPLARAQYEMATGVEVEKIGFCIHPRIDRSGASPDGLVGEYGLVEIKVPTTAVHLEYLIAQEVPEEYKPQMTWQMACSGRAWCDFVSYDPRLPEEFGLFIKRFTADEEAIKKMEAEVEQFIVELNEICEKLLAHKAVVEAERRLHSNIPRAEIPDYA